MTKKVRIENADLSDHKLVVQIWDKSPDGDVLVTERRLLNPCDMTESYVHTGRYVIVKEEA